MVHEKRQDKDFTLITSGEPIFLMLSGETVCYEGEPYYTIFINEAAYYEKGFAMCLAKKVQIEIEI